ncbi:fibronectin type III domain-containing protein [Aquimarina sediminis]|uniref:fibronectin type III domain-containing protein n=1 Tax=Aquimarina sediminis TaxID=2070536 RepID=UPI000CA04883|nr:M64 family metallopeptidase [Aquimarina sediminis]
MKKLYPTLITLMLILWQYPQAQTFEVVNMLNNGSNSEKVNIVFVGDGYQSNEMTKYINDVQAVVDAYFNIAPYNEIKTSFNVYAIKVPSNESGAGLTPETPVDNYFGSTYGNYGMDRLLVPSKQDLLNNVVNQNTPFHDKLFVIVNHTKYGGSGGNYATFSTHADALDLALHEGGHSYGELADEYWAGTAQTEKVNLTQNLDSTTIVWNQFLGQSGVGIYPHEEAPTWYRPHQNCKMRFLAASFCPVCQHQIKVKTNALMTNTGIGLPVPADLAAINITTNSFTGTWTASPGATTYDVQLYENDAWVTKGSPTTNSFDFSQLVIPEDEDQYFRVRATDSLGSSNYSDFFQVVLVPTVPIGLNTANITGTSFTANWTANKSPSATSYDVYLWENNSWVLKGSPTTNNYNFSGLALNSTQHFIVQAHNGTGSSDYSDSFTANLVAPATPGIPTGLNASNITGTSFTANWTAVAEATSYDIQLLENGTWITKGSPVTNTFDFSGLALDSSQTFRVRSKNSAGNSDYSASFIVNLVSPVIPGIPTNLSSSNITTTSFTANWTTSTGVTTYDMQLWENGAWTIKGSTPNNTYNFSNLASESTQYLRIRATNTAGSSDYTDYITVTLVSTAPSSIPAVPSGLSTANVTPTSFTANWTASLEATSYDIQLWEGGAWVTKGSPATNTYNFTGLVSGSIQYFRVLATNSLGSSEYSNYESIQLPTAPAAPPVENNIFIHPNPVSNILSIKGDLENPVVKVMDVYGNVFVEKSLGDHLELDLSHLSPKVYILNIRSKDINENIRFIKE